MWPWKRDRHESCPANWRELEERLGNVEIRLAEDRLKVLEALEKVAERLAWRERKRQEAPQRTNGGEGDMQAAYQAALRRMGVR